MRSPLLSLVALLLVSVGDGAFIMTRSVRQFGFFRERHRHASSRLRSALLSAMLAPLLGRSSWPSGRFAFELCGFGAWPLAKELRNAPTRWGGSGASGLPHSHNIAEFSTQPLAREPTQPQ